MPRFNQPSKRLEGYNYSRPERSVFITMRAQITQLDDTSPLDWHKPFTHDLLAKDIVSALLFYRDRGDLSVWAYCLMPDHLHLLASATPKTGDVIKLVFRFKSYTTRTAWNYGLIGKLWQADAYDHIERKTTNDFQHVKDYILNNPIKAGLVTRWEEYPYTQCFC